LDLVFIKVLFISQNRRFPKIGEEISKLVGIKATTISHWQNQCPEFAFALAQEREKIISEARNMIVATIAEAVSELSRLVRASKSDAVRLKACEFIISNFVIKHLPTTSEGDEFGKDLDLSLILRGLGVNHVN
jgi:hypothetical protein